MFVNPHSGHCTIVLPSFHTPLCNADDFYHILVDRQILTVPIDRDDTPDELVLAHLRISLQAISAGKTIPLSQLWDDLDD